MKYSVEEPKIIDVLKKISIPEFQRHLVWTKKNKKKFIESIMLEFPIGVITAYEEEHNGKLTIIDGLQRLSTLIKYYSCPSEIVPYSDIIKNMNLTKYEEFPTLSQKQCYFINLYFQKWYEGLKDIDKNPLEGEYKFFKQLEEKFKEEFKKCEINEYDDKIITKYNLITSSILLSESTLPIIICKDLEKEELPIVFERMNTGSVKLSKYEIYTSKWFAFGDLKIADNETKKKLIQFKKNRYIEIFEQEIECLEEEQKKEFEKIYLHDILIYYSNKYNSTTVINKKRADEVAFELFSLVTINKVYGIDTVVNNELVIDGKYKSNVGTFMIKVLDKIMEIMDDSRINYDESFKFKNYYYIASLFAMTSDINLDKLEIMFEEITNEMIVYITNTKEKFDEERQITYLHGMIDKTVSGYKKSSNNLRIDTKIKRTAKVLNITHAGNPHPQDSIRIQVNPSKLRSDRNKGYYTEIFGKYELNENILYIKFNFEHAINSQAKNKSIYVKKESLVNKISKNYNPKSDVDKAVDAIYSEEEFHNMYLVY